jgi:alkanesulfonate monooxygenase SsuD/methylene tetrahydromethanopterin reductase-like flavin-dependent oxidoreductase (luciferase family)
VEIGLYTFAEVALDLEPGSPLESGQRFQDLLEEMALTDQVGLDVFGVGEHHRPDFAVSSPAVALAAGAALGSPQQVIDKILLQHELFGNDRFLLQMAFGAAPHEKVMRSIELLGTVLAPPVRKAVAA